MSPAKVSGPGSAVTKRMPFWNPILAVELAAITFPARSLTPETVRVLVEPLASAADEVNVTVIESEPNTAVVGAVPLILKLAAVFAETPTGSANFTTIEF